MISYDRELLERALRREGRLAELLRPFALPELDADAESLVCLLPRPGDRTYWGRPVPIEPMTITLSARQRLRIHHREPLPAEFTSWEERATAPAVTTRVGDVLVTTMDLELDPTLRMLLLGLLFGRAIFI